MALLPARNILDGTKSPATTTSDMKTALGSLRDYLAAILGTDSATPTFPSMNGGPLAGLRNRVINGGMQVSQRGSVAAVANSLQYGGCDRTAAYVTATTVTGGSLTQVGNSGMSSGVSQTIAPLSGTGVSSVAFFHRIEAINVNDMNGKYVTVSFSVYHDTGLTVTPSCNILKANSKDNFNTTTLIIGGNLSVAPSGSTTRYSYTALMGATDASNGLQLQIGLSHASVTVSAKYYSIGDLQLELGTLITPFEQRPYGMELALCQRYFESGSEPYFYVGGTGIYTTSAYGEVRFAVTKRAAVTVTATGWKYFSAAANAAFTPGIIAQSVDRFGFQGTSLTNWGGWTGEGTWTASAEI